MDKVQRLNVAMALRVPPEFLRASIGRTQDLPASPIDDGGGVRCLAGGRYRQSIRVNAWSELDPSSPGSAWRTAEIIFAFLSVLAIPIGMNLEQGAPRDAMRA